MSTVELPVYQRGEIVARALLDPLDFAWARHFCWRLSDNGYVTRGVRNPDPGLIYLHKVVGECAGLSIDGLVDHRDGNKLNCARDNLRATDHAGNMQNVVQRQGVSRFRGVSPNAGKWEAKVRSRYLGRFEEELIAGQVAEIERHRTMPFAEPDPALHAALREVDWSYGAWPSGEPYDWAGAGRGGTIYDAQDPHLDLGCGKLKKGRIGIDHFWSPGVDLVIDLDDPNVELPFKDGLIKSVISHHALEHLSDGFLPLIDELYRVLQPGGIFYAITPLFPSRAAVEDPDHKRYFMCNEKTCTWDAFCGHLGDENNPTGSWLDSFSVPYTNARFEMLHKDYTAPLAPELQWGPEDVREMRVALRAVK